MFTLRLTSRTLALFSLLVLGMSASSCSLDMFSKHANDKAVSERTSYRQIRPECSGITLQSAELDPKTFRALMNCLGSNGSMPEMNALIADASEARLAQSVELMNDAFLRDPEVLKQSRAIVHSLEATHRWAPIISGFQSALEDPERLRALVRLLSFGDSKSERGTLLNQTFSKTVARFDARETMAAFELFGRLVSSKSYRNLQAKISADPVLQSDRAKLVSTLSNFFKKPTKFRSAHWLLTDMTAGKSAPLWQYAFGESDTILPRISEFTTLLHDFGKDDGLHLRSFSRFQQGFQHTVSCWGGGKVFDSPWKNLTSEFVAHSGTDRLLPFILRFASTTAMSVKELCEIPSEFYTSYPDVTNFALGRSGGAYLGVVDQVFTAGLGESAGYFVGEWGDSLADILSVLEAKPWFGDLILLIAELDSGDRDRIASWMSVLLQDEKNWNELTASWQETDIRAAFSDIGTVLSADPESLGKMLESISELFEASKSHPWFEGWKRIALKYSGEEDGLGALVTSEEFPNAALALSRMAADGRLADLLSSMLEWLGGGTPITKAEDLSVAEAPVRKTLRHDFGAESLLSGETKLSIDAGLLACTKLDVRRSPADQWDVYQVCLAGGGVPDQALAGLKSSGSFLETFISGWISLPITTTQKQALISQLGEARDAIAGFFGTAAPATDTVSSLFHIANRFETALALKLSDWDGFFGQIGSAIGDDRFPTFLGALGKLEKPESFFSKASEKIGPAAGPDASLIDFVKQAECGTSRPSSEVAARVTEIDDEFRNAVQAWDPKDGKFPATWETSDLNPRLRVLTTMLASNSLRGNLYAWLSHLNPSDTAAWFHNRAIDPKAVIVMDTETMLPRVRWMTSIDRLESILVNSNFSYLLPGNYGVRFIGKFAEAWGDEPRANWPKEIQAKYPNGKRPPTLREVFNEVNGFLKTFAVAGGLPRVPDCTGDLLSHPALSAPNFLISKEIKAKAFNLKQTLSVVEENLPDSQSPNAGGMRFLRNLFWAVYSSEKNPVQFFQALGDLGALRVMSRGFQSIETGGELLAVEDAVASLGVVVKASEFDSLIRKVISSPTSVETYTGAADGDDFSFSQFSSRVFSALAVDRTVGVGASLLSFFDQSIGEGKLPEALIADGIHFLGTRSTEKDSSKLFTLRTPDEKTAQSLKAWPAFFQTQIIGAFRKLPVSGAVNLLDRDPLLRKDLFIQAGKVLFSRQKDGEKSSPTLGDNDGFQSMKQVFLSPEKPELRRAFGLWCGRNAGSLVSDLASRPDEFALIIGGLFQSAGSPMFHDFLEAFLRQLPD